MRRTFAERLTALRKDRGLTQQALADIAGIHVVQIARYETSAAMPSVDGIRKLAVALSVPTDLLLFDEGERGPEEDFRLRFEALQRLDPDEKQTIAEVIDGMILKHEAKRWAAKS